MVSCLEFVLHSLHDCVHNVIFLSFLITPGVKRKFTLSNLISDNWTLRSSNILMILLITEKYSKHWDLFWV